ncbi:MULTISPECIES: HAD family hydrolase [Haloferax]|uniref:Phosphoglycolate phosphatase n=1 Tax=Haloferax massiliensis TaxID=1476858 RepID=A0A0D6JMY0_9EURY|nr:MULTISPECIES: HAD family hydrolase [Haloferax]MDS0243358.1 HAD family hydrolase [Haloferax sp. S2CR25]MDS0446479.1 HAD family hydrolase [Haloferax sp. S2CR25-2]CQR48960.1 Phosphoglycolate phosphatase [Haloferax massiliensis]
MCYDAVIFDNDGVLTKPTLLEVQREAVRRAFAEFDVEPTTETVDGVINGGLTRLRRICSVHDVPVDEFWSRHETHAAATQRTCLEDGTKPLYDDVTALDDIDHPLAVVSNNQHATIEHILDVFDIGDRFEVAYGRDPTVEGARVKKPDPHYIERAMGELGVDSALYVGDSNVDVVAADRAGIDSAFIRRPHRDGYQLAAEPTYELDSLDELLAVC